MHSEKLYTHLYRIIAFAFVFWVFAKGAFEYANIKHWLIALIIGSFLSGIVVLIMKLANLANKRYSKDFLTSYYTFVKRPMNIATIGIIFMLMIPVLGTLFIVSYCFIKVLAFGIFLLNGF